MPNLLIPLADRADAWLRRLAHASSSAALANLDGATLLGERAMLAGSRIPGTSSAGGGCRLLEARRDGLALNLAREADRELLPALFETVELDPQDDEAIAARVARSDAASLVARGRALGLAIASVRETLPIPVQACVELVTGIPAIARSRPAPRIVDLSALWAGPLASHLLWLAGAEVIKVESLRRPDAMRAGGEAFFALLNQGKASVVLDLAEQIDRQALLSLIASADIVIEAARPRALAQLGIDAVRIVRATPGLVWITITGHGAEGEAAGWVGFGDDCGVAGGLSAALQDASGRSGFVGDAIADPLTGIFAATVAWDARMSGQGGRFGLTMSHVAAQCLAEARASDPSALKASLSAWSASVGQPFPAVARRPIGALPALGADTQACLARTAPC